MGEDGRTRGWPGGCSVWSMSFAKAVDRVRADFLEMPGLELTVPQAVRLWSLGVDDCRHVLDALVDAGFLKWTAKRTIIVTGRGRRSGSSRSHPTFLSGERPTTTSLSEASSKARLVPTRVPVVAACARYRPSVEARQ